MIGAGTDNHVRPDIQYRQTFERAWEYSGFFFECLDT